MDPVTIDARVRRMNLTLVEPKEEPSYVRTVLTLEVDHELSPDDLAKLKQFQRGLGALVTFETKQLDFQTREQAAEGREDELDLDARAH